MAYDRSPQRVVLSVKKNQVRYYHRILTFRKTRSERTTRRQKKVRIKVDVSQPPLPYVEPKCCVKLAIHHGVAAYYTNYVLRCDTTCFCNELCDFVCGRRSTFNSSESLSSPTSLGGASRPKSMSCDSGFDETDDEDSKELDSEFVNIDVGHQSVWFCRYSPPGPEDLKIVRSSLYQVMSESATETECSGPSNKMCFRWHKDWQKSANAVKTKRKKTKDSDMFTYSSPRSRRPKKETLITRSSSLIDIPCSPKGRKTRRSIASSSTSNISSSLPTMDSHMTRGSPQTPTKDSDVSDVISDYDSSRDITEEGGPLCESSYISVLEAIKSTSRISVGKPHRTSSFHLHVG